MIDKFIESKTWSIAYQLPLCSEYNNPWIYCAYAQKIMWGFGETLDDDVVLSYYERCRNKNGTFNRWPNQVGGTISHDELIGAAYLHPQIAKNIFNHLILTDGYFSNIESEPNYVLRHTFLMPYLRARLEMAIGPMSQLLICLYLFIKSFNKKPEGSKLKIWLMHEAFAAAPIISIFYEFFFRQQIKYGVTVQDCFKEEIKKYPIFSEIKSEWND